MLIPELPEIPDEKQTPKLQYKNLMSGHITIAYYKEPDIGPSRDRCAINFPNIGTIAVPVKRSNK